MLNEWLSDGGLSWSGRDRIPMKVTLIFCQTTQTGMIGVKNSSCWTKEIEYRERPWCLVLEDDIPRML